MHSTLHVLLLQVRNPDDPMRQNEVQSFARVLRRDPSHLEIFDLLARSPTQAELGRADLLVFGGAGHYSAAGEGDWLERILDLLREVHAIGKPTFASCWGFQAMARAMGGRVINDVRRAEVGTRELFLTPAGRDDPIFGPLGERFLGQMGHEDRVEALPPGATLLASSDRVENQAYRFDGLPIYCTQFHPELSRGDLYVRLKAYPEYIERIVQTPLAKIEMLTAETPETEQLLHRFVEHVFG
ncbi:MAG: type 1 glutamine amidotransferase [Planctomycetes bacterium]|nr:type 1 glutamine amidotransferase [Planctomycetota bacterium]